MDSTIETKGLLIPECVNVEKLEPNKTKFSFLPLENGFGITIGNAFRRVLLSRIKGYAINAILIPGVKHEYSTIDGVLEDVCEIILKLKQLSFKQLSENVDSEVIDVKIDGNVFCGADINNFAKNFEVVNTGFEICHFAANQHFEIKLYVDGGYGLEIAKNCNKDEDEVGKIYIDSIYSPVKNVAFEVNDMRVGDRLDYNSLNLIVETNGAVTPEMAVKEAADILIKHFVLFTSTDLLVNRYAGIKRKKFLDVEMMKVKELLNKPISSFGTAFGKRALNCLNYRNIIYLKDLVKLSKEDVSAIENLGDKTLKEISDFLDINHLQFGMDITKYGL